MSTVKYVRREDIVLKTLEDCFRALLDGFVLSDNNDCYLEMQAGFVACLTHPDSDEYITFFHPKNYKVYEKQILPWYETATFPVICWVTEKKDYPVMIISYEQKDNLVVFKSEVTEWLNAVPVTLEEFKAYNEQYSS